MLQKSILTLLFSAFIVSLALSQPVLQNTILPDIGDAVKLTEADTINTFQGNAGANQTWNFSAWHAASGATPIEYLYISPVGTPYAASHPTATIVTKINQDTAVYAYFREQANSFTLLGSGSLNFIQNYPNPDIQLKFPTNFNGSFQDDFVYTTDAGTGVVFVSTGSRTTTYDAYGTLTTPLGIFPDAMRIKGVSTQVDSASFSGIEIINHTNVTTYGWLVAGQPGSMASVYYTSTITETRIPGFDTLITVSPVTKSANYVSTISVGVFDLAQTVTGISDISVGPNPAIDHLTLRFQADIVKENLQLIVSDASGRVLQTQSFATVAGENQQPLSVDNFAPGSYFLTLTDGHGVQTLNWIKQ